nr:ATP synthase F0 subunit 8 [Polypylis sp. TS-2018]WOZ13958.1 ATP synthase F0 subunit 8 [Polypylis sp. TS-2018]
MPQLSPTSGVLIFLFVFISMFILIICMTTIHEKPLFF